jgi:hypothetical protein
MNTFKKVSMLFFATLALAFGQAATPSTTLCANVLLTATSVCLSSTTNVVNQTGLYIDGEYMVANISANQTLAATNAYVPVTRGNRYAGTGPAPHNNAQTVWLALTPSLSTVPGDNGFEQGSPQVFNFYGPCTRGNYAYMPRIIPGRFLIRDCSAATGLWTDYLQERTVFIGPGNCNWTTTGTYAAQVAVATGGPNIQGLTVLGASNIPVNQISVTNAGASVNTLNCYFSLSTFQPLLNKGITVTSADLIYGVQTTALTSISGGAFATITFPTGASQTASTVTPVAVGGTPTQSSTTGNLGTTTAGAFRTSTLTPVTPINLNTNEQLLMISEAFNQSASAAEVLNTPGILVHYTELLQ